LRHELTTLPPSRLAQSIGGTAQSMMLTLAFDAAGRSP
jgi:hypothetical protein